MIFRKVFASLIVVGLAAEVWSHVEIEAEDYFFPLEPDVGLNPGHMPMDFSILKVNVLKTAKENIARKPVSILVINFCKMSDQCQHDFVPICGQDSLGITRMFNDNCDLYEYNCDEKKQYRHVKMDVCKYEAAAAEAADTS